jgi:hypothetical protein
MNNSSLFSGQSLVAGAILVASSIGGLYSCQKKLHEAPCPALGILPFEAMQRAFNAAGREQALMQSFGN